MLLWGIIIVVLLIAISFLISYLRQRNREQRLRGVSLSVGDYSTMLTSPIPQKEISTILQISTAMGIKVPWERLNAFHKEGVNVFEVFLAWSELNRANIRTITLTSLMEYALKKWSVPNLVAALKKAQNAEIDLSWSDINNFNISSGNILEAVDLLIEAKNAKLSLSLSDLTEHISRGGSLTTNVKKMINLYRAGVVLPLKDIRAYATIRNVDELDILTYARNVGLSSLSIEELQGFPPEKNLKEAVDVLIQLHRAGIKSSLKDLEMYSNVREIKELVNIMTLINSQSANLGIRLDDLKSYPENGDLENAVELLIKARQVGVNDLTLNDLKEHFMAKGNVESLVNALISGSRQGLSISVKQLKEYFAAGRGHGDSDPLKAVQILVKARQENIDINLKRLEEHIAENGDATKLIDALIISKQEELGVTLEDFEELFRSGGDVQAFARAAKTCKKMNFGYTKERLMELQRRNTDILGFAKALRFNVRDNLQILQEDIEKIFIEGYDILKIIVALQAAKNANIPLSYDYAVALERAGKDVSEAVRLAIEPQMIETPDKEIVAKDGVEVKVKALIQIKGNINQFFSTSSQEAIIARVSEAMVSEMVTKDFQEILAKRDWIAKEILTKLQSETEFNSTSSFQILRVDIPDIEPIRNTKSKFQSQEALHHKEMARTEADRREILARVAQKEVEIKLKEAEASKVRNIGEAFKEGKMSINDHNKLATINK